MARKLSVPKDFQVGDIVLVEQSGKGMRRSPKWDNGWSHEMEAEVGKCLEVMYPNSGQGVWLKSSHPDGATFGYPEKVLRLIRRGKNTYYRKGDKVLIARHAEGTYPKWDGEMYKNIGKAFTVTTENGQNWAYSQIGLIDDTGEMSWYGSDCTELYTGQMPDEQPQPQPIVTLTITEPLQAWERF